MNYAELLNLVDTKIFDHNPKAFVCTPETFRRLQAATTAIDREDPMPWRPAGLANPLTIGVPIRVEADPHLGPGEVLLELP